MDYKFKNNKYIFNKEGVHFSLTIQEVAEMRKHLSDIEQGADEECITDYCGHCGKKVNRNNWREHMLKTHICVLKEEPFDKEGNWLKLQDCVLAI